MIDIGMSMLFIRYFNFHIDSSIFEQWWDLVNYCVAVLAYCFDLPVKLNLPIKLSIFYKKYSTGVWNREFDIWVLNSLVSHTITLTALRFIHKRSSRHHRKEPTIEFPTQRENFELLRWMLYGLGRLLIINYCLRYHLLRSAKIMSITPPSQLNVEPRRDNLLPFNNVLFHLSALL